MGHHHFELTARGHLPADTDVDAVLRTGDELALHAAWSTFREVQLVRRLLSALDDDPAKAEAAALERASLAELADVTALQALEANRRLSDLLTGRRWAVMQAAREAGASWTAIGDALGMSKQGALDWYKRKIEQQERHVPANLHDADRARAALTGDDA
ncbi:hypothetical protein [Nocardia asteroides]|uniref:hypothetical protein n=1 Tax=Nocardia asteroides TaxID=1824 RepID=UPI00340597F4